MLSAFLLLFVFVVIFYICYASAERFNDKEGGDSDGDIK